MFTLEALPAKHGDSLLLHYGKNQLIVIDGGPAGVHDAHLGPRLKRIRDERGLAAGQPLLIELMMVSHIDADHITGILELVREMAEAREAREAPVYKIKRFWHNAFEDSIAKKLSSASNAADAFAAGTEVLASSTTVNSASVAQGRQLMKLLPALKLDGNPPFNGVVSFGKRAPIPFGDLTLTVIGPNEDNLELLRKDWAEKVVPILEKEAQKAAAAAVLDKSPYNLSSIVVLAKLDGKRMLLTGDGRGDHTLTELKAAGLLEDGGVLEVDLLKLPHHGSIRNSTEEYLRSIRAKHYVISADGRFDNPDLETMELLTKVRDDDDFTIHITNPLEEFVKPDVGVALRDMFAADHAAGRKYKVRIRKPEEKSIMIAL
jgi:beta-lactamase superfamily II metal-dependent hydrolase